MFSYVPFDVMLINIPHTYHILIPNKKETVNNRFNVVTEIDVYK